MARGDLQVITGHGPTITYHVQNRTSSSQTVAMEPGEPVKTGATAEFIIPLATGDPEIGSDEFLGIVRKKSTESTTVEGTVEVVCAVPGLTLIRGKATTKVNMDTAAELLAFIGNWVSITLTGAGTNGPTGVFTFDEDDTSDPNVNGFKIIRGNTTKGTLDCMVNALCSQASAYL